MSTVITGRDTALLKTLAAFELLTTRQIATLQFPGVDKRTVLRRLRKLEKEKLIRRIHGLKLGELAWTLNQYGAFRIGIDRHIDNVNRNGLEHDTTLVDVRIALERCGMASSWVTEQHLRRSTGTQSRLGQEEVIPDAIFAGRTSKGFEAIALELELSGKNPSRYAKVFSSYGERPKFFALWYIVSNESLGKRIAREWEKVNPKCTRPQFGWMILSQVLSHPTSAEVHIKDTGRPLSTIIEAPKAKDLVASTPTQL